MTRWLGALAALAALAPLAGCGEADEGRAGLTADQERELNEIGDNMLGEGDVIDVSPDSMTLNESAAAEEPPADANGQ